jgi:membrane carboxypeptidase/penicillin-binding protein
MPTSARRRHEDRNRETVAGTGQSSDAAVKTGTTDDFRDNWMIGYTSDLLVGVWVGNADNSLRQDVSGISGAAPIWHDVMARAFAGAPVHDFAVPSGIVRAEIFTDSGLYATPWCPRDHQRLEYFVAAHAPTEQDAVWQRALCRSGRLSRLFVAPIHDVGDLFPYDQILIWAGKLGGRVLRTDAIPCVKQGNGNGRGRG